MEVPFRPYRSIRASDADREAVTAFLKRQYAEGRLSDEELSHRVEAAYGAVEVDELETLIGDLPGSPLEPAGDHRVPLARTPLKGGAALLLTAGLAIAFLNAVPPELWAFFLVLALPLGAMLLFAVLSIALPLAAGAWMLRLFARQPPMDSGERASVDVNAYRHGPVAVWRIVGMTGRGRHSRF